MKHKILAIDDSPLDLAAIELLLEEQGFQVKAAQDPEDGIAFIRQNRGAVSLAIVDYNMPGKNGAKVTEILKQLDPKLQIATYSGDSRPDVYETLASGSQYFIQKGIEADKLLAIVKMFCNKYEELHRTVTVEHVTDEEIKKVNETGLTGISRHLVEVVEKVHVYAPLDEIVLITGENGTGKEKIARAIYNLSRCRGAFIPVNCAAIPHELLESELFGHVKGAFSGAVSDKTGLVQTAIGGTLFLDEIGDLPLHLQVKILRFLQEGEVRPVGSNKTSKIDTRVILATNVNLEAAIIAGRFRQDLFYRIQGFQIHLKPLRERKEDIRPLVARFSEVIAAEKGVRKEFLEATVKLLMRHEWPGNIRELEHEVRRAIMLAPGSTVTPTDISESICAAVEKSNGSNFISFDLDYETFKDQQRRRDEEEERKFLVEKSNRAKSIRELARDVLKISNSTLQGRLKSLGIDFKTPTKEKAKGVLKYETT